MVSRPGSGRKRKAAAGTAGRREKSEKSALPRASSMTARVRLENRARGRGDPNPDCRPWAAGPQQRLFHNRFVSGIPCLGSHQPPPATSRPRRRQSFPPGTNSSPIEDASATVAGAFFFLLRAATVRHGLGDGRQTSRRPPKVGGHAGLLSTNDASHLPEWRREVRVSIVIGVPAVARGRAPRPLRGLR